MYGQSSNFKLSSKPSVNRRATRGAWRHRYDGDKRSSRDQDRPPSVSSSSSDADTRTTSASKPFLAMNDPSVSYKDVLLRFAELTQIEKQPGSPQVSNNEEEILSYFTIKVKCVMNMYYVLCE